MNSGATAERVYEALKRRILTRAFRPGERLDPATLGDSLSSSVTPVRDALHLLAGEGLVTARTGEGFHMPPLDEPALSDLYAWTGEVLLVAIRARPPEHGAATPSRDLRGMTEAHRTAALFEDIAAKSGNAEHRRVVVSLNDRLHCVRLVEASVLDGIGIELEAIEAAVLASDGPSLRRLVTAYHRRRQRHAAALVRAVYRAA